MYLYMYLYTYVFLYYFSMLNNIYLITSFIIFVNPGYKSNELISFFNVLIDGNLNINFNILYALILPCIIDVHIALSLVE